MARFLRFLLLLYLVSLPAPSPALLDTSADLSLPPNISVILDHIYSGRRDLALPEIHELEQQSPADPLGYLLDAEAQWWQIWCVSAEFKYGMTMPRHHEKGPLDARYLELTSKAYSLAEASLRQHDTGEMHLYAAMADALASRLYGIRGEYRATARNGVRARENFLKALSIDPSLADAYAGLGLYNYYVDTLSALARVLRFFMGIPGGSKEEGIRQLERAMRDGQLSASLARFYLALNLENYDQRYEKAFEVLGPLVEKYPDNPIFLLVRGDLYAKMGRKALAESSYRAAAEAVTSVPEPGCRSKLSELARESLASLGSR